MVDIETWSSLIGFGREIGGGTASGRHRPELPRGSRGGRLWLVEIGINQSDELLFLSCLSQSPRMDGQSSRVHIKSINAALDDIILGYLHKSMDQDRKKDTFEPFIWMILSCTFHFWTIYISLLAIDLRLVGPES